MIGKGLLKRALLAVALLAVGFAVLAVVEAQATPIRPDIRRIVEEPQQDSTAQFMPARAGWDGPEMASGQVAGLNVSLDPVTGSGRGHSGRAELMSAATPDPRAILGIAAVIFLLRLLKKQDQKRVAAALSMPAPPLQDDGRMAA